MCGRFVMASPFQMIAETFRIKGTGPDIHPGYNIAPGQAVYAVVRDRRSGDNRMVQFRWGLVPSWAKDPSTGTTMINARAESVANKPSFKDAFKDRRCLIVADGFYEWRKTGRKRTPFLARLKSGRPFGFAGLHETWVSPAGEKLNTCTIITTRANDLLEPIHDRMPVIVPADREDLWLAPSTGRDVLLDILKPFPPADMDVYEVSPAVNSPRNDSPDLLRPFCLLL